MENFVNEIWLPVQNYEELYEISNYGRVRALDYRGKKKKQVLKTTAKNNKYIKVGLRKEGKNRYFRIHRLVAQSFLPPPIEGQTQIDHIDGNPQNNYVRCEQVGGFIIIYKDGTNLRWATPKENMNNDITKQKLKQAHSHISEETRRRMSEGQKRRFRRERNDKNGRNSLFS